MSETQPVLPAQSVERLQQFAALADGEGWRCDRFDLLAVEVPDLRPADLPAFHAAVLPHPRSWDLARKLWGFRRVIPRAEENPDDWRVRGREGLANELAITRRQLQAEIDGVRGLWLAVAKGRQELERAQAVAAEQARAAQREAFKEELPLVSDEDAASRAIVAAGFDLDWFDLAGRSEQANRGEKVWFARRLAELAKLFARAETREVTRRMLLQELKLRRKDDLAFSTHSPAMSPKDLQSFKTALLADEADYRDALDQINKIAPWAFNIGGAISAKGCFAEVIRGYQEWHGQGDPTWLAATAEIADLKIAPGLVDGLFDAEELQALLRPNAEVPEPQYRLSLSVYAQAVKANLWNPKWQPQFPEGLFAAMDEGYKAAFMALWKKLGLPIPNLLRDGPEGEHLPLAEPPSASPTQPTAGPSPAATT